MDVLQTLNKLIPVDDVRYVGEELLRRDGSLARRMPFETGRRIVRRRTTTDCELIHRGFFAVEGR